MQRTSATFQVVIAISLISMAVSVNEAFAGGSFPTDAFVSNVILTPGEEYMMTEVSIGGEIFPTASANGNGQSPFMPVEPGMYNVEIQNLDEAYRVAFAECQFQESDGSMTPIGMWDGVNTVSNVDLIAPVAYICTWTLEHIEESAEGFTASAEEQKLLEINGDPASNTAWYTVVVTGQITPGPLANPGDKISSDGTTLNGGVLAIGKDSFYFTGEIVSITTAANHIFTYVDGIEVANDSEESSSDEPKFLEINGDPASNTAWYTVVVTGQITPGPLANPGDKISSDGTTLNGGVLAIGKDSFYFTGEIVSITTAANHIFTYVDGIEVANSS